MASSNRRRARTVFSPKVGAPLVADVFAGRLDPGDISIVRSVKTAPAGTASDTAVFTDAQDNYTINGVEGGPCPTGGGLEGWNKQATNRPGQDGAAKDHAVPAIGLGESRPDLPGGA